VPTTWDQKPWLLGVENGVIDLCSGIMHPGRQDDLISMVSPIAYQGIDHQAPTWEWFLKDVFENDIEIVEFLGRLFGYAISGLNTEHVFPLLIGRGRNGKSTIIEVMQTIMGDLSGPVPAEMLLDQGRVRNSSGPTPDIMALHGLRMAFASETDDNRKFSHSRIKWLTGGDTLTGRHPHDRRPTNFKPSHTIFFATNSEPNADASDFAFWERVFLIPFELSYVDRELAATHERPADKELLEKLKNEAPGILSWLVRGCIAWQQQGFNPSLVVKKRTEEYRLSEDLVQQFIDEICYKDPHAETSAADLYAAFCEWWTTNMSPKAPSQKRFGKWMVRKFKREKIGTYRYYGVGLLEKQDV